MGIEDTEIPPTLERKESFSCPTLPDDRYLTHIAPEMQHLLELSPKLQRLTRLQRRYEEQLASLQLQDALLSKQSEELENQRRLQEKAERDERIKARKRQKEFMALQAEKLNVQEAMKVVELVCEIKSQDKKSITKHEQPKHMSRGPVIRTRKVSKEVSDLENVADKIEKPQESRSMRRKQMVSPYALDLTPLIYGEKPKVIEEAFLSPIKNDTNARDRAAVKVSMHRKMQKSPNLIHRIKLPEESDEFGRYSESLVPEIRALPWLHEISRQVGIVLHEQRVGQVSALQTPQTLAPYIRPALCEHGEISSATDRSLPIIGRRNEFSSRTPIQYSVVTKKAQWDCAREQPEKLLQ